jgi:hypothetical protein
MSDDAETDTQLEPERADEDVKEEVPPGHEETSPKPRRARNGSPKPVPTPTPDDGLDELPFLREKPRAERALYVVRRALARAQVRAMMFEHASRIVAVDFGGTEVSPPKLLFRLPGAGSFPAEREDVHELEVELLGLAAKERSKVSRILSACVMVDPTDIDINRDLGGPLPRPPADEVLVCNAAYKTDGGSSRAVAAAAAAARQAGK